MNFLKVFEDIFRWFIWTILKFLLFICDQLYLAVKSIACFNVMGESVVWAYFGGFMVSFLSLFIIFRLAKRYMKSIVDDEEDAHFKPENIILKIAAIGFLIVVLPVLLKSFGNLLSLLIDKIESIFGVTSDDFSTILISSADIGANDYKTISLWVISEKTHGGDYVHIPSMNTFLCLTVATLFSFYLMLLIGIQLGGRILSMVMKLIIAPYAFSSIVDEKNDSFSAWWKLFVADFLATYVQMLLLLIGTSLILGFNFRSSSSFVSGLAKDIALIGALFAVLNAPNGISQIIGADIGVSSALQSMQTSMMAMGITSSAGRLLGNAGSFAVAGATYGTGRLLGGASMKSIAANTIPGVKTLSGTIQNMGGNWSDGQSGAGGGGNSDLNLTMSETPSQKPSFIDSRGGASGLDGIRNNPSGMIAETLGNTNVARVVNNYANNGGNAIGRTAAKMASWGGNKMYSASMNRLQQGFNRQNRQANTFNGMKNPMMYNFSNPQMNDVAGGNSNGN